MKKYQTEEERKAARRDGKRKWHQANRAARAEYMKQYYNTQIGRALHLLSDYRQMDIKNGFGDCIDFNAQWIVENIFTQKCAHCDCTDWRELGCNRIDNDLPHIKSNVEPCCWDCNNRLANEEQSIPIAQFDRVTGELIAVWKSAREAARQLGYSNSHINECCNGKLNSAYGSVWRKISNEEYEMLRACFE